MSERRMSQFGHRTICSLHRHRPARPRKHRLDRTRLIREPTNRPTLSRMQSMAHAGAATNGLGFATKYLADLEQRDVGIARLALA